MIPKCFLTALQYLSTRIATQVHTTRAFQTSAARHVRRRTTRKPLAKPEASQMTPQELFNLEDIQEFADEDTAGAGHRIAAQEREVLNYFRLIDGQMQELQAFRQPYVPPDRNARPLVSRSISYGNEKHPATRKTAVVVPVSKLPLNSPESLHKFILLAGVRWSPTAPKDSGLSVEESEAASEKGFVKVSCELFPDPAMNLKWACDSLNKLVQVANRTEKSGGDFIDIPLDFRHIDARRQKHKRGEHRGGLNGSKPTIKDFPQEWLPELPADSPLEKE